LVNQSTGTNSTPRSRTVGTKKSKMQSLMQSLSPTGLHPASACLSRLDESQRKNGFQMQKFINTQRPREKKRFGRRGLHRNHAHLALWTTPSQRRFWICVGSLRVHYLTA
jgi:hypothetical protein